MNTTHSSVPATDSQSLKYRLNVNLLYLCWNLCDFCLIFRERAPPGATSWWRHC